MAFQWCNRGLNSPPLVSDLAQSANKRRSAGEMAFSIADIYRRVE